MPIFVDVELTATPNPTSLPKRIELQQTLHSTLAAEAITVAYTMAAAHNIWFKDGSGGLVKQILRTDTIGKAPQVCIDRLTMVTGPGSGPLLTVEVTQAIRDSQGNVTPGLCVVQITP